MNWWRHKPRVWDTCVCTSIHIHPTTLLYVRNIQYFAHLGGQGVLGCRPSTDRQDRDYLVVNYPVIKTPEKASKAKNGVAPMTH